MESLAGRTDFTSLMFLIFNIMGIVISSLIGMVLFFVKKLIRDVQETTKAVATLAQKIDTNEKENKILFQAHDKLSERVRLIELEIAKL